MSKQGVYLDVAQPIVKDSELKKRKVMRASELEKIREMNCGSEIIIQDAKGHIVQIVRKQGKGQDVVDLARKIAFEKKIPLFISERFPK
jgi:hypothetical protein